MLRLAALMFFLLAAPAVAIPPDPPIELQSPADGERLPVNADGITVGFTCPPYTEAPESEPFPPTPGVTSDYGVGISSSAAVAGDGRLATRDGSGAATEVSEGVCESRVGGGFAPGTWYWQAWRACSGCPTGWEVSPVRRLVLASDASLRLSAPKRAYAGYTFAAGVAVTGLAPPAKLVIERRTGSTWRAVTAVAAGEDDPIIRLPRGSQRIRLTGTFGTETVSSPVAKVTVARAKKWRTSKRDDGSYRDGAQPSVRLRVTGGGRRITGFRADVPTLCAGGAPGVSRIALPPIKVAPDGRFAVAGSVQGVRYRFTGRLKGRKLTGARAAVRTATCSGSISVQARRRG